MGGQGGHEDRSRPPFLSVLPHARLEGSLGGRLGERARLEEPFELLASEIGTDGLPQELRVAHKAATVLPDPHDVEEGVATALEALLVKIEQSRKGAKGAARSQIRPFAGTHDADRAVIVAERDGWRIHVRNLLVGLELRSDVVEKFVDRQILVNLNAGVLEVLLEVDLGG